MKRLFIILMFLLSFPVFAETQQSISNTLDESTNCRSISDANLTSCADSVVSKNVALSGILPLMDDETAYFASFLINKFGGFEGKVNLSAKQDETNRLFVLFDIIFKLAGFLASILLTWNYIDAIGHAMINKKDVNQSAIGWTLFNNGLVFLLVYGKLILTGFIGAIVAGIFVATINAIPSAKLLSKSAEFDEAAYYQRAERYARNSLEPTFNKLVKINVDIDSVQLNYLSQAIRFNQYSQLYMADSSFEKCLNAENKTSDSFFHGVLKDSRTIKTQGCLLLNGYKTYEPGQLAYSGSDTAMQQGLIELNKAARKYAYEFRKMACDEALSGEDSRVNGLSGVKPYTVCLNRSDDGKVIKLDETGLVDFLPKSDLDLAALSKIKTDAIGEFATVFAEWSISQRAMAEVDTDLTSETDLIIFMYRITQQDIGYPKWQAVIQDEFHRIAANADSLFSASDNGLGNIENKQEKQAAAVSGNIANESKFMDIQQSLAVALRDTMRPDNGQVLNWLLAAANLVGGNAFDNAGFTGQNCFAMDNTCIAPFSNQIASSAASNLTYAENMFYGVITTKSVSSLLNTFASDSSWGRLIGGMSFILGMLLAFSVLRAVASLIPFFVFVGMISTYAIRSLTMILLALTDLLKLLVPNNENRQHTGLNSAIWRVFMTIVWLFIAPSICIGMFFVSIAFYGSCVIALGYIVYEIATHFIGTDGSIIVMFIQFGVMMFIFQLIDLLLMVKITMYCANIITVVDKLISDNTNINNTADAITHKVNSGVAKALNKFR